MSRRRSHVSGRWPSIAEAKVNFNRLSTLAIALRIRAHRSSVS
jgi:hypothetical protein